MAMSTAKSATEPVYQRLGRYEILGEIASGGMATVYLGRVIGAKGFSRLVAIKKLHPHLERNEEFVAMFLDEARLAARIRHPNVVPTLDVEDQDGLYIVMEYVEGDRLLELIKHAARKGERIPMPIALRIAFETLSGLHAAHELVDDDGKPLNIVHRDVSPQNVLVGIDGVTKLTDFGIAKAESRLTHTREGQLKGKIAYMAPEQTIRGPNNIDRRVDIFAAGILTWEMLTGRRLFRGETDVQILNALLNDPIPRPRSVNPEIPEEIESVVMRALERPVEHRWPTAADFAEALEKASATVGGLASTRTVAQYVQQVAGPKLEQERARLKAGLALRSSSEQSSSISHVSQPRGDDSSTGLRAAVERPRRSSSTSWIVAVVAVAAVAAMVGGAAFWFGSHRAPAAQPIAAPVAGHGATPARSVREVPPPPAVSVPLPPPVAVSSDAAAAVLPIDAGTAMRESSRGHTPSPSSASSRTRRIERQRGSHSQPAGQRENTEDDEPISSNPYRQ